MDNSDRAGARDRAASERHVLPDGACHQRRVGLPGVGVGQSRSREGEVVLTYAHRYLLGARSTHEELVRLSP